MKNLSEIPLQARRSAVGRLAVLLALLSSVLPLNADPITREQAQQRAEQFLQGRRGASNLAPVRSTKRLAPRHTAPANAYDLYYVFDRGDDEGFVIASGDDRTEPVLGYCDNGHFDYEKLPDAMKYWLDDYAGELQYLQLHPKAKAASALPTHPPVDELMTTKWNQGDPYNYYSPQFFNQGKSVSGCVATAMAQVLYYNRAKSTDVTLADIPDWDGGTKDPESGEVLHNKGVPKGSFIDFANCRDLYTGGETEVQRQAVGWLMYICGAAVKMNFTNSGSGAATGAVPGACIKYLGYRADCHAVSRSSYSAVEFDAIIYNELANRRVMQMAGGGHSYVCDGYDGNRYYHINWGWGGGGPDGYYLLSKLTPGNEGIGGNGGFGYSSGLYAIINQEPADYGHRAILFADKNVKNLCVQNWDTDADGELSFDEAAAVSDLGTVFKDATTIRYFTELTNFTGLTAIADEAFSGCARLTSLVLPADIRAIGRGAFRGCRLLSSVQLPEGVSAIGAEAFMDCRALKSAHINEQVIDIEPRTFQNCVALTAIDLHADIQSIGDQAFSGCTKLTSVTVQTPTPQAIQLGQDVFESIDLKKATLNALQGTREFFETAGQWKEFGNIRLTRVIGADQFTELRPGRPVYLWNVGRQSYLAQGEYNNCQSVLSDEPMQFIIYEGEGDRQGLYYLYSPEVSTTYKITGRGSTNTTIGTGVCYTFVNGNLTDNSYWAIRRVADGIYTFQVPEGFKGYDPDRCWGIQPDHRNDYIEEGGTTMGAYYDVPYAGHEQDCQWMFVDYLQTYGIIDVARKVEQLLAKAKDSKLDCTAEQRVFDDLNATYDDLLRAQTSLRRKLGFIVTDEETLMNICIENWDLDGDGEISQSELEMITELKNKFQGASKAKDFSILQYFVALSSLEANAFSGCSSMEQIVLPQSLTAINTGAFRNCRKLESLTLPEFVTSIATQSFTGCTSLRTLQMQNPVPEDLEISETAFSGLTLGTITLQVPIGTRERYAAVFPFNKFKEIKEVRTRTYPKYSTVEVGAKGYLYHPASRKYLCGGEAYGTQAVVGTAGYLYEVRRSGTLNGVFYLWSDDSPNANKIFFRSSTDSKVGKGIKSCFIDGAASRVTDKSAPWKFTPVEGAENIYTLTVPQSYADYVEGQCLGIQNDHETNAVKGTTWGTYWDIPYEGNERACQWAFISQDDVEAAAKFDSDIAELRNLIDIAAAKDIDTRKAQAVYDDFHATAEQVDGVLRELRRSLHLIHFTNTAVKLVCLGNWDTDDDGELSFDEAAAVTDLGAVLRGNTAVRSFDELRYFTGLTTIPTTAFRGSSLVSLYLPANVRSIADGAFSGCSKLKYIAFLGEDASQLIQATAALGLSKSASIFVPTATLEAYANDDFWKNYHFLEYTGVPTVQPTDMQRLYGRTTARLTYTICGAPVNGEPVISCQEDLTTPAGSYPIVAEAGTITSPDLLLRSGTLTVQPTPLTVAAKSCSRAFGEANPTFEVTYKGWRNKETEEVLLQQPVVECDATPQSPAGEYEIRVSGAEAQNYIFEYVSGKLTVVAPVGVRDLTSPDATEPAYDLSGRPVSQPKAGLYITRGKKISIRK